MKRTPMAYVPEPERTRPTLVELVLAVALMVELFWLLFFLYEPGPLS